MSYGYDYDDAGVIARRTPPLGSTFEWWPGSCWRSLASSFI